MISPGAIVPIAIPVMYTRPAPQFRDRRPTSRQALRRQTPPWSPRLKQKPEYQGDAPGVYCRYKARFGRVCNQ
eukprot:1592409-Lingulodinium_polyedra.AAC.1